MGRIKVLDKHVASLIAAGEVVQRSGSVVKELVENSIDAGATSVVIEIKAGGISFIRVSDNGCGMSEDDAEVCILRHATSKIYDEAGLERITSLGFRGEALASICAVSKMEIITRAKGESAGISLRAEGGDIVSLSKSGCPEGTTVIIRDLFYNTPARLKFLKKDSSEAANIMDIVERTALGNPGIAFKFIRDGKTVLQTYGDGNLRNTVYAVLGKKFLDGMVDVQYEKSGITIKGLVCSPYAAKNNRSFQNFYINGRYIHSKLLSGALQDAYGNDLFTGKFPSCVIDIIISPSRVDVNVDPEKLTVKFSEERNLYDALYFAVKSALVYNNTKSADFSAGMDKCKKENLPNERDFKPVQAVFITSRMQNEDISNNLKLKQTDKLSLDSEIKSKDKELFEGQKINIEVLDDFVRINNVEDIDKLSLDTKKDLDINSEKIPSKFNRLTPEREISAKFVYEEEKSIVIVGELYKTYIIVMYGSDTYIIDKHAAHERIIFEKIKKGTQHSSQILLQPQSIMLSSKDFARLMDSMECLNSAGFDIEDFGGNTVLVRAVPYDMSDSDVEDVIYEIIEQLKHTRGRITENFTDEMMKSVACKAAIKAGYKTSASEMEALAKEVLSDECYRYCPHGRPTYLKITEGDLKKQFSRT